MPAADHATSRNRPAHKRLAAQATLKKDCSIPICAAQGRPKIGDRRQKSPANGIIRSHLAMVKGCVNDGTVSRRSDQCDTAAPCVQQNGATAKDLDVKI